MRNTVLTAIAAILLFLSFAPISAEASKKPRTISLNMSNTLILNAEIDLISVDNIAAAAFGKRVALPENETLYVLVASAGGSVLSMVKLVRIMRAMPNTVMICKYCASVAGIIFATANEPRLAIKKSELVMHEMYQDHVTAKMLNNPEMVQSSTRLSNTFNEVMYTIMKMTKENYEKKITNTTWTVRGEELVKLHLADELVNLTCDERLSELAPDSCTN